MTETLGRGDAAASGDGFARALRTMQARLEQALAQRLPATGLAPARLHQAMAYSSLNGGKRVRAVLVYASGEAVGADPTSLDAPACAVEMIHAYSLVHDDLPCMDDDDLRRGKPTCHKAFDQATALLVGDALQSQAFICLAAEESLNLGQRVAMLECLARASGSTGMAGGQAIDLAAVGQQLDLDALETMHRMKTGALIRASARLGGIAGVDVPDGRLDALDTFAGNIGLAFQIQDDILDVEGSTAVLGKARGADLARNKPTYPSLLGMDAAKQLAQDHMAQAIEALAPFGERARLLRELAHFIVSRVS